jgi:hypothetical protein
VESHSSVPRWRSIASELDHFEGHGSEIGAGSPERYTASALATIATGRRFTYVDETTGQPRVGYFHRPSRRLTVLTSDERLIVNHFRCEGGTAYVRGLIDSTY